MSRRKVYFITIFTLLVLLFIPSAFAATYTYDNLGRLISVSYDSGQKVNYEYDPGGNIRKVVVPDITPPTITSTNPLNGETGIAVNKSITIQFNENIQASTNYNNISLKAGTNVVGYTPSLSGNILTITPNVDLGYETQYTVDVPANSIKDMSNNNLSNSYSFIFTTTADTVALIVYSINPVNGATNVPINSIISVAFSEEIQPGSNISGITLEADQTIVDYTYSISGDTLTLSPKSGINYSTNYVITILAGTVQDVAGNTMATDFRFGFSTEDDTYGPIVSSIDPGNGAIQVPVDKSVYVTFNENVLPGPYFNEITLKTGDTGISATYTINGNVLSINPDNNLSNDLIYTVTLPAGAVSDILGNPLSSSHTFSFNTPDTILPTIISTSPINGAVNVVSTQPIVITFSENIQCDDLRWVVFKAEGVIYPKEFGYDASSSKVISDNRLIIYPKLPMSDNTTYYVTVSNITDIAGNYFEPSNPELRFTTGVFPIKRK